MAGGPTTRRGSALALGLALALAIALVASAGCKRKPKPGTPCVGEQLECVTPTSALVCAERGAFVASPCRGPKGCTDGDLPTCDVSAGKAGDPCEARLGRPPRAACTEDGRTALVCRDGALAAAFDCLTFDCHLDGAEATCGAMTASVGYACATEGATFCGDDQRSILRCTTGRLARYLGCHGKLGCAGQHDPSCDNTLAALGDPCALSGFIACSDDGRAELICRNGRFAHSRACDRTGCQVTDIAHKRTECH